jgi:ATP-binding protein involved in chromosome partitioning
MSDMPSREEILKALEVVIDPELRSSIVELGMVRSIDIHDDGRVAVMVSLTTPGCPIRSHFQTAVAKSVSALDGVTQVDVAFDVLTDQEKGALQHKLGRSNGLPEGALALVSNILCIGSGKGGVGKSTITANLAAALAEDGKKVGILDADVWGYSIPRMYGLGATRPKVNELRKIVPLEGPGGVKVMSIGFFVQEDSAVVALAASAAGAVPAGHDAAADRAEGRAPRRRDGPQGQPRRRGGRREHVRLHDAFR